MTNISLQSQRNRKSLGHLTEKRFFKSENTIKVISYSNNFSNKTKESIIEYRISAKTFVYIHHYINRLFLNFIRGSNEEYKG